MGLLAALSDWATVGSSVAAALVGAVVGGLITARAMRGVEERRRQHADQRSFQTELQLLRAAARVQADVFTGVLAVLKGCRDHRRWLPPPHSAILAPAPQESRMLLAQHLTNEAWDSITDAETAQAMIASASEHPHPEVFDDDEAKGYAESLNEAVMRLNLIAAAEDILAQDDIEEPT